MPELQPAETHDFIDEVMEHYVERFEWADTPAIELSYRVSAAYASMRGATHRLFASLGHERASGKVGVLRALYFATNRRMSQNEISNNMNVASASVTYMVDALEKEGLVTRRRHPTDRRVTWVELTEDGEALFTSVAAPLTDHMTDLAKGFTDDEKRLFREFLMRYKRNAETMHTHAAGTLEASGSSL